jgi:tRNA(Leu) C34 or U34 (ribose-2'-O)-methylase TrmL
MIEAEVNEMALHMYWWNRKYHPTLNIARSCAATGSFAPVNLGFSIDDKTVQGGVGLLAYVKLESMRAWMNLCKSTSAGCLAPQRRIICKAQFR